MRSNEFTGNWRLILRLTEENAARKFLSELERTLEVELEVTVCEPFTETAGRYDCVFVTRHVFSGENQLVATARAYSRLLPGQWRLEELQAYEDGVMRIESTSAQSEAQQSPEETLEWGHFWMTNQEILQL